MRQHVLCTVAPIVRKCFRILGWSLYFSNCYISPGSTLYSHPSKNIISRYGLLFNCSQQSKPHISSLYWQGIAPSAPAPVPKVHIRRDMNWCREPTAQTLASSRAGREWSYVRASVRGCPVPPQWGEGFPIGRGFLEQLINLLFLAWCVEVKATGFPPKERELKIWT